MPWVKQCCCCCKLQTGAIVIGAVFLVGNVFIIVSAFMEAFLFGVTIAASVFHIIDIIACVLLIVGAVKVNTLQIKNFLFEYGDVKNRRVSPFWETLISKLIKDLCE